MNDYEKIKHLPDNLVIFDLDGCLHDDEWRLKFIKAEGPDRFSEYHSNLPFDQPLKFGKEQLLRHLNCGHGIIFITARPNSARKSTVAHIRHHHGPGLDACLFMRGDAEEGIGAERLKCAMFQNVLQSMRSHQKVIAAYDDRPDIVKMYIDFGVEARVLDKKGLRKYTPGEVVVLPSYERDQAPVKAGVEYATEDIITTAADILSAAANTFRERNAVYKDNADNVGKAMAALFPNGVQIKTAEDHKMYHLFELMIVKLTRFANSGLTHTDSIHDLAVYAAMCENLASTHNIQFKAQ